MKKFKAFTLIELLIVVAIISIIATVAIANMSEAMDRANIASCAANLKVITTALFSYRIDHNHYPPADSIAGIEPSPTDPSVWGECPATNGYWSGISRLLVTNHYISDEGVLYCPVLKKKYPDRRQKFRYAYNSSAANFDGWEEEGSLDNIERDSHDIWLCRCLWLPPDWNGGIQYPHPRGNEVNFENVLYSNGRVELSDGKKDVDEAFADF